jgi:hypothetical protein
MTFRGPTDCDSPDNTDLALAAELRDLWAETRGDPRVRVVVLDGPVDRTHPSLQGARLWSVASLVSSAVDRGPACRHGTHVTSVIFGQPGGPVKGVAPACSGVIVPIFESVAGRLAPCSQLHLAHGISLALAAGAQVINISGGEFAPPGAAHPLLANVLQECARRDVLVVAAAGNEGCACPHIPAALESVLAVGAMNARGEPLPFSNWGEVYRLQGVLALGENICGAEVGGGTVRRSGTSYATAIVSGVAALLLSLQYQRGLKCSPRRVREAILGSALGCDHQPTKDWRLLAGRLNVNGAVSRLLGGTHTMTERGEITGSSMCEQGEGDGAPTPGPEPAGTACVGAVRPSACSCTCGGTAGTAQLVYALGQLGYDLVSEARRDSLWLEVQAHPYGAETVSPVQVIEARTLLDHLDRNSWKASAVEWILNVDATPVYAIHPQGPFAEHIYAELRHFLRDEIDGKIERIAVAGRLAGAARLFSGQVVPVIVPEPRGLASWNTKALEEKVIGAPPPEDASQEAKHRHEEERRAVGNYLERVYHELRNLGLTPQERALNHAATNAFTPARIFEATLKDKMELDTIRVSRSPLCRPGSDCWDIELYFFYPERVQYVRKVYRFTVDVSDIVPVTVGPTRSWFVR